MYHSTLGSRVIKKKKSYLGEKSDGSHVIGVRLECAPPRTMFEAHLVPLQGHVTGTCLRMIIVKLIRKTWVCPLVIRAW